MKEGVVGAVFGYALGGFSAFFDMGNDVQQIATLSRLPVLTIGAALVFGIYAFARREWGELPALSAAALAATSPNLLAHAKVATSDLGCAAAMFQPPPLRSSNDLPREASAKLPTPSATFFSSCQVMAL